jgi:hypothetical protein
LLIAEAAWPWLAIIPDGFFAPVCFAGEDFILMLLLSSVD